MKKIMTMIIYIYISIVQTKLDYIQAEELIRVQLSDALTKLYLAVVDYEWRRNPDRTFFLKNLKNEVK